MFLPALPYLIKMLKTFLVTWLGNPVWTTIISKQCMIFFNNHRLPTYWYDWLNNQWLSWEIVPIYFSIIWLIVCSNNLWISCKMVPIFILIIRWLDLHLYEYFSSLCMPAGHKSYRSGFACCIDSKLKSLIRLVILAKMSCLDFF